MEIGIWGDSITYGDGDTERIGWAGRLRRSLSINDRVYVFGVCGDTTSDLLKRFDVEASSIEADVVLLAIGINDSKYIQGVTTNNVPLDIFKQNMRTLIQQARKYTDKIFVVGLTRVNESIIDQSETCFRNDMIQVYDTVLRKLSEAEQLSFIDVSDVLEVTVDLYDGLHPNAQGYEKLFNAIKSHTG